MRSAPPVGSSGAGSTAVRLPGLPDDPRILSGHAAGGIETVNEGAHTDVDDVLGHYRGEAVVCLVGADTAYADWGGDLIAALREAGARWVIVAGQPRDDADDNCAMGVDALDFLNRTREKLA